VNPHIAAAVLTVLIVAALDLWVYADARARQGTRREVAVTIGSMGIDRPEMWLAWCLILFVFFFPLYLVARREAE
jgi:ABC-type Fe3+ transport system permease subunit